MKHKYCYVLSMIIIMHAFDPELSFLQMALYIRECCDKSILYELARVLHI